MAVPIIMIQTLNETATNASLMINEENDFFSRNANLPAIKKGVFMEFFKETLFLIYPIKKGRDISQPF